MENAIFVEMKKCYEQIDVIGQSLSQEEMSANEKMLTDAVKLLREAGNRARKEGILNLQEYVMSLPDVVPVKYVKTMLLYCIDGMLPELIVRMSMFKYCAARMEGYLGLTFLIYLQGVLDIQAGINPDVMTMLLKAMLPEDLEMTVSEEEKDDEFDGAGKDIRDVKSLYKGEMGIRPNQPGYIMMKFLELTFEMLDDRSVQRVLQEMNSLDIVYIMKALDGVGRKRILTNVSKQNAIRLTEEINFVGPIRVQYATKAGGKMLDIIYQLVSSGEIRIHYEEKTQLFCEVFKTNKTVSNCKENDNALSELKEFVRGCTSDII